jgi:uncharacterized cupredoxin-like copper-binding protein
MQIKYRSIVSLVVVALMLLPMLSACGGPSSVDIILTTYVMKLSTDTVKAGKVTFNVKNDATDLMHEAIMVRTDIAADQLPMGPEGAPDEETLTIVGAVEDVEVGKGGSFEVTLEPGHYVIFCNIDNHFSQGMTKDFTVTP